MSYSIKRGAHSRKKVDSSAEELTAGLTRWAELEMGLTRSQLPTSSDVKMLLSSSAGRSIWQYLITHIKAKRTVTRVRKNIRLQCGDLSGARSQLLTKRAELGRELTSLHLAVTQLESDVSRLNSDIALAVGVKSEASEEVKECCRKSHLLSAHSVKCRDMVNVIGEFSRRIYFRIQVLSQPAKEKSYFAKSVDSKTHSLKLESACKHDLSRSCDQVRTLLTQLSTQERGGATEDKRIRQAKEQIWTKLESLLSSYSPAELMQCLCELTDEAREFIHTDTASVDLSRDAKLLRYHYDNREGLKAEVKRSNLLKSVEEHLMVLQLSHLQRSVVLEQHLASAAKARERLSQLKYEVDDRLSSIYGQDREGADIAREVFEVSLEVSGCQEALSAMIGICDRLNSIREEKRLVMEKLENKRRSIDQFTQIAEEKQSCIQSLVQANSSAWSRLNKQRNELVVYVRTKVVHHESELVPLVAGLHDSVALELKHFSQLSLARMLQGPGTLERRVNDFTIHRLRNTHLTGLPHWAELLETLGVASYRSPEGVLSRINYIIDKVEDLKLLVREKELALEEVKSSCVNTLAAREVLLSSKHCDRQQLQVGIPELQLSLSLASQGLDKCSSVQQTLHEWWDQPAQLSGQWITYEGMNLEKWIKQWTVLSTKLQQISSSPVFGSNSMTTVTDKPPSYRTT